MISQKSPRRFLSLLLSLVCLAVGGAGALRAEDVKFPADGSGIVFTLPDGWTSAADAQGNLKCVAADGKFDIRVLPGKKFNDPAKDLAALGKQMADSGKLTDRADEAGKEITKPDGTTLLTYAFQGKAEGAELTGTLILFTTKSGAKSMFMIFDPTETVNAHGEELTALITSVKSAK